MIKFEFEFLIECFEFFDDFFGGYFVNFCEYEMLVHAFLDSPFPLARVLGRAP